ncbi:MAG: glycosyltransferase family 2 protein [Bacteroidetes bacterium]|nr:glycosyltransferase family 2 protein [Bacteroidota bacterium]MBP7400329.1 glycosyltransferase family 2 protein [Chitinophagales bacterium]MBK7110357.1 glycosyltransferase family 2 protein [Bacteroidota bacterium]MBK8488358.1 glycosyltransferase family 2 protein [Bacteroidota bacterium]MBP8754747.1 glycosyltransferase family 2 protein [Chitinophagales bacterium]
MQISVIIPVYNAEAFVAEAVHSALQQTQVEEIILIDDGSTDTSAEICLQLANINSKIKFLQHADKKNHGAGAARNLGIANASFPFIAFLDADDLYLPNRFDNTEKIFELHSDADGVYGCLGIQFQTAEDEQQWKSRFSHTLTHMYSDVAPEQLALQMSPLGNQGWFSIDTLTIKKSVIERVGGFSNLRLSQDTEFILKLAITSRLYSADNIAPIAVRRVHGNNRITSGKEYFYRNRLQLWKNMMHWSKNENMNHSWYKRFRKQYNKTVLIYLRFVPGFFAKIKFLFSSFKNVN